MGANPTQAIGITLFLIAFVLLAGAMAGGGILYVVSPMPRGVGHIKTTESTEGAASPV